jgi:hypothetical protein
MEHIETWKPVESINGLLEVSNMARVRTVDRETQCYGRMRNGKIQGTFIQRKKGKILAQCKGKHGYLEVGFMYGGVRKRHLVHRLVGFAFVPGYFEKASIDHLDGDKTNNLPSNLEWVTASENTRRQWESGLVDLRGELAPGAKLTNLQAHAVAVLYDNNFPPSQIGQWFGVSSACVYKIASGEREISGPTSRYARKSPRPRAG